MYGDADAIAELTGTENPRNARALLVDAGGTIVWFHDEGYSARVLLAMLDELERIAE